MVIPAGVIGLAAARRRADEGRQAVMLDPAVSGSGAAWSNAGRIAGDAVRCRCWRRGPAGGRGSA